MKQTKQIIYTIDVEPDLNLESFEGVTKGLKEFEKLCDKHKIKPILFTTANCIEKYPQIFKKLKNKGYEIALHSKEHNRFDDMSREQKEEDIKDSLKIFKKYLRIAPKGFRAPQHSIDQTTLDLLEKYDFEYDSSLTPLNLLQLFFFPKKFKAWSKSFFTKINKYQIRQNLVERPSSALLLPFVSITVRVLPLFILKPYVKLVKLIYKEPMFYAHSWDFIELKNSRIDRKFPHEQFIRKLDKIMEANK